MALRVRSLAVSVPFYTAVLGLREVARLDDPGRAIVGGEMAFLSFASNHHDLALLESPQTRPADPLCAGLAHIALRIGDHIETLQAFHARLRDQGVALTHARDHEVSQSLYLRARMACWSRPTWTPIPSCGPLGPRRWRPCALCAWTGWIETPGPGNI